MSFFDLRDLQHLKVLNSVKLLVIVFLVLLTVYLVINKPSYESKTKIQFDKNATTRDTTI